jgi:Protein of unknown function (DUF3606)
MTTGNPDRQRINRNQDYEVRDWAKKFGVSEDQRKAAVLRAVPGLHNDHVAVPIGVERFSCTHLGEPQPDQLAHLGVADQGRVLRATKDEHGDLPGRGARCVDCE